MKKKKGSPGSESTPPPRPFLQRKSVQQAAQRNERGTRLGCFMARWCPIVKQKVTYQFCEDCEERLCNDRPKSETAGETDQPTSTEEEKEDAVHH